MTNKILVYGTLRVGHGAYSGFGLDKATRHLGTVRVPGTMYHLGGFPGIVLDGDLDGFWADLLEITDEDAVPVVLQRLDDYEGYREEAPDNSLYLRKEIGLPEYGTAFIYEINRDMSTRVRVASGDWNKVDAWNRIRA
jgi:gamma-glutamylcyclotransferase (GGCT)/AIG2-like uncharacterized protein YtfP